MTQLLKEDLRKIHFHNFKQELPEYWKDSIVDVPKE